MGVSHTDTVDLRVKKIMSGASRVRGRITVGLGTGMGEALSGLSHGQGGDQCWGSTIGVLKAVDVFVEACPHLYIVYIHSSRVGVVMTVLF